MKGNGDPHGKVGREHGQPPRIGIGLVDRPGDLGHAGDECLTDPEEYVVGALQRLGQRCHGKTGPLRALARHEAAHLLDGGSNLVSMDGHDGHDIAVRGHGANG